MMAMMLALVAMCVTFSSCSSDDDDNKTTAAAAEVVGTYEGDMTLKVSSSESTSSNMTFKIEKVDDNHVNVILPAFGEAPMALPSITVTNLLVTGSNGSFSIPESTSTRHWRAVRASLQQLSRLLLPMARCTSSLL